MWYLVMLVPPGSRRGGGGGGGDGACGVRRSAQQQSSKACLSADSHCFSPNQRKLEKCFDVNFCDGSTEQKNHSETTERMVLCWM
ncbi:hypothetical protein GUJ93_ZPchr0002g23673 [Zizania palustris]|uniref:Uncharacterized protein n=1 Tax=Zizania palustris TaxID=103762 RepID=A0A8J5S458_ZIZPA|nr:hypothetical protein GUJ93_ZPchr0002g23673 [Zizania palustris]